MNHPAIGVPPFMETSILITISHPMIRAPIIPARRLWVQWSSHSPQLGHRWKNAEHHNKIHAELSVLSWGYPPKIIHL
jgi:hypothetical protein